MADAVDRFFHDLSERGHEPLLRTVTGSIRFDVVQDDRHDRWRVDIDRGTLTVTRGGDDAGCTIGCSRALLDAICKGETNAMAAVLRGDLACDGDVELFFAVQRLFPGAPGSGTVAGTGRHG